MIGDSIAFIYLSKWDIKPLAYKHDTREPKQGPGYILGKQGSYHEIKILRGVIKAGYPALLTDITNSIRHGDLCVLLDQPLILEIKKSKSTYSRLNRQIEEINKIKKYLLADETEFQSNHNNLSDFARAHLNDNVETPKYFGKRIDIEIAEVNHIGDLNRLISIAYKDGYSFEEVEKGVYYLIYHQDHINTFPSLIDLLNGEIKELLIASLNLDNFGPAWTSYTPFYLSIKKTKDIINFLEGKILITIFVDTDEIKKLFPAEYQVNIDPDIEDYFIQVKFSDDAPLGISKPFFSRVFYEFLSMKWLLKSNQKVWFNAIKSYLKEDIKSKS